MKRISFLPFLVLASLVFVASCASPSTKKDEEKTATAPATEAKALPSLSMTDITGNTVDLASLKGKKVFVNLWASWCPPCRSEMPSIEALYKQTDKDKVAFVMLSMDNDFDAAKSYIKSSGLSLPFYYPAGNIPSMFNVEGIPATFIFDEKGELIKQNMGAEDYNSQQYVKLLQ